MQRIHQLILWLIMPAITICAQEPIIGDSGFNKGWREDSSGDWIGTGGNFGSGWRRDSQGDLQGTGNNFGKTYRPE